MSADTTQINSAATLVEVARMYYEHRFSQQQIAEKLGISRPGVSRLLRLAREKGIVRIDIVDPADMSSHLESNLQSQYGLKKVLIVPNEGIPGSTLKERLGMAAARFLDTVIEKGLTLGVSWGTTMQAVTRYLRPSRVEGMTVVQLVGGFSRAEYDMHAGEVTQKIAGNYQAAPFLLPLPAIVDNVQVKNAMLSDKNISRILEMARTASVAMFSVGTFNQQSALIKAEYLEQKEIKSLLNGGGIGDICTHIVTPSGEICSQDLDDRTLGVELNDLREKPFSITVAGGLEKVDAIRACLLGHYCNILITDELAALELLKNEPEE